MEIDRLSSVPLLQSDLPQAVQSLPKTVGIVDSSEDSLRLVKPAPRLVRLP